MISINHHHRQSGQWPRYHISRNCTHFDSTKHVYEVHFKKGEEKKSIIEGKYHRIINRALHRAYYKLTPHRLSKCNQHRNSKSTYHRISKATYNLRFTTVAPPPSPHSSHCPTISHCRIYKRWLNLHRMHSGEAQAQTHQSQDQAHYKAISTHTFGWMWTILHAHLRWPSLLYPIHWWLHTIHLRFGPSR